MTPQPAIVYTCGHLASIAAKTCHGLLRGSERFRPIAVVDEAHGSDDGSTDAGTILGLPEFGVPVFSSLESCLQALGDREPQPSCLIVGVALPGGALPESARGTVIRAIEAGLSVVCGLHTLLSEDPELAALAVRHGVHLVDVRKPRPSHELTFWSGSIYEVKARRVAVLGTDCAIGKRTTCKFLLEACRAEGMSAEMIYTGQTGWMQGHPYGFIFDITPNDFVCGELEKTIVTCDRERSPDLILLEGQSALRNASGPCGSEFLLSAAVHGVVLQHAPGRVCFHHQERMGRRLPSVQDEVALIAAYGVPTLAVTLNEQEMEDAAMRLYQQELEADLGIPVVRPLKEGVGRLVPLLRWSPE